MPSLQSELFKTDITTFKQIGSPSGSPLVYTYSAKCKITYIDTTYNANPSLPEKAEYEVAVVVLGSPARTSAITSFSWVAGTPNVIQSEIFFTTLTQIPRNSTINVTVSVRKPRTSPHNFPGLAVKRTKK
jgi:hypothetical protein